MRSAKKRKQLLLYGLVFLLFLSAPADIALADGPEFNIDGSGFTEPAYDTSVLYFWHEGLPTVLKDTQGNYIKYPILITWNDMYYLRTDSSFKRELEETHTLQEKQNGHYEYFGEDIGYISETAHNYKDYDRVWANTDYYMRYLYDMKDNLIAKLGLDANALKTYGEAASMSAPELPYVVPTDSDNGKFAIGLNEDAFGENVWLVGSTRTWEEITTTLFGDDGTFGDVQWGLDYQSWNAQQFLDKNYVYKNDRRMYDVNASKSYEYKEGADQHYWTIRRDRSGKYHLWTMGENVIASWARISGETGENNRQRMRDWFHANDLGRMSLYYSGSTIGASAETVLYKNWNDRVNTVSNTGAYTIYYADPNLVNFYRNSFTVAQGQVIALEGPVVIDSSCCITVKDGGVLSCSGWVINNGCINVEPGGMLIVQNRETHTGDFQYGAITSVDAKAGTGCGRIACDGMIIVSSECKLSCAGTYGLQLGATAQVANYGTIIAENMEIYADRIIENRGENSAVFAGWGITDSGYALTRVKVTGQTYYAKGTKEKTACVRVVEGAVYGEGASRFYVNGASSVTYSKIAKSRIRVSENDGIGASSGAGQTDSDPPIFYDSDYDVYFLMYDGKAYEFSGSGPSLSGSIYYWVYAQTGLKSMYKHDAPDPDKSYPSGQLPDGYKLLDGRTVNRS